MNEEKLEKNQYICENCNLHFETDPIDQKKVYCPRCRELAEAIYLA